MPKLIVSIDGVVVKEVQLTKDRSTLGRRPYNDIVLDHLAVSGEHARIEIAEGEAVLEDLGSTNGTFVNGRAVRQQALMHEDLVEIGRYQIRYLGGNGVSMAGALHTRRGESIPVGLETVTGTTTVIGGAPNPGARVRVLSGPAAGRELILTKPVTTIGKRGYSVARITRGTHGFEISHVEGVQAPTVNGVSVDAGPIVLQNRDQISMGSVRLEYMDR